MNTATAKQIDYINKLQAERDLPDISACIALDKGSWASDHRDEYGAAAALNTSRELWKQGHFTSKAASTLIDLLLAVPRKATPDVEPSVD